MELNHVVKSGVCWPYERTPNCKQMIGQLERNEALVTWICPKNGGIAEQFPAIRVKENYYTMSLRMMKGEKPHKSTYAVYLRFNTSCVAPCAPEEEFREPRDDSAYWSEAQNSRSPAGGKDAYAAAL